SASEPATTRRVTVVHLYGNRLDVETQSPFSVSTAQSYRVHGQVEIVETHLAINEIEFSIRNSSIFEVESGATVTYGQTFWLGDEADVENKVALKLPQKSAFNGLSLNIGSAKIENEIDADLAGEQAECELRSLVLATRRQQVNTVSN